MDRVSNNIFLDAIFLQTVSEYSLLQCIVAFTENILITKCISHAAWGQSVGKENTVINYVTGKLCLGLGLYRSLKVYQGLFVLTVNTIGCASERGISVFQVISGRFSARNQTTLACWRPISSFSDALHDFF